MMKKVKGTYDVLPTESYKWGILEEKFKQNFRNYNILEIRTPILEYYETIHRNGDSSTMVSKETYDFFDKSNRQITLRPEGTAGVCRAIVENKLYADNTLLKLFYLGPNFRYERPQKGRYRQFMHVGVEYISSKNTPLLVGEVILCAHDLIKSLGLKNIIIKINTLGNEQTRKAYQESLIQYFSKYEEELCSDCKERLKKNPLRILDCKNDCRNFFNHIPLIPDFLEKNEQQFFEEIIDILKINNISYEVDHHLVRGLDYYDQVVFEIVADLKDNGSANVLGGGGCYNNLIKSLGGPDLQGCGFAYGIERLLIATEALNNEIFKAEVVDYLIITLDNKYQNYSLELAAKLRNKNYSVVYDLLNRSNKAKLKDIEKLNLRKLIFIGEEEFNTKTITIKDVQTKVQTTTTLTNFLEEI